MRNYIQKTDEEYLQAIEKSYGIISLIAILLGISYSAVWQKLKRNKHLQIALEEIREKKKSIRRVIVTSY